jgi:alcohol dehydrogenase (cytochrome c)
MKMLRLLMPLTFLVAIVSAGIPQVTGFVPVTPAMLLKPSPDDWLNFSRTYDAQRFSPLDQINKQNVTRLMQVWSKPLASGTIEIIPIVYRGIMYVAVPASVGGTVRTAVQALDAATGKLIWEYTRPAGGASRAKSLAIFEDLVIFAAPDAFIVALDAQTGRMRWETKSSGGLTAGTVVFEDKVLTGRACGSERANCYVAAHDARTGKELWRFYTAAGADDPAADATWAGASEPGRVASPWGLGGSYDSARKTIYWGVANPSPYTRAERHGGNIDAVPRTAPANLYSNSTIALNLETGKLSWYYQHLPGDDWDQDFTNERILLRTRVNPDPKFVKWINPDIPRGEERDVVVNVGEGGGLFVLDRATGRFLWANPFPYDVPNFLISGIDVKTGKTTINWDVVLKKPGERHVICAYNTKSYWPMSYHPAKNALYIPYVDDCLDMTRADGGKPQQRTGVRRPGSDPERYGGIAKVDMATGEIRRMYEGRVPGNGATLATAGDLVFWGDLNQKFRAFDADTGKILWETTLGGPIQNSTITYRANGRQFVAVLTGLGALTANLFERAGIQPQRNNAIHVFALPD